MKAYSTLGAAILAINLGCKDSSPLEQKVDPLDLRGNCNISFANYQGMCRERNFAGYPALVKNYDNGDFDFFQDHDNDGCFETRGRGFYSNGTLRIGEEIPLPSKRYCLTVE